MAAEVTNNQAVLRWRNYILQGDIFVWGAVQVKDANSRVFHCDVDSMDLGLLSGVHFETGGHNVALDKY